MLANDPRLRCSMSDDRNAPRNISPWKNAPTPIPAPTNPPFSQTNLPSHDSHITAMANTDHFNPYSGNRTTSNLSTSKRRKGGAESGNRTANSTITVSSRGKPRQDGRKRLRLAPETIDQGTLGSSDDEIDALAHHTHRNRSPVSVSNDGEIQAFGRDSDGLRLNGFDAVAGTSRVLEDGPSTRSLTRKLNMSPSEHGGTDSPIEEFPEPPRSTSKVKSIVSSIEGSKNQNMSPHLDLRTVPVKNRMKPKRSSDPIATASSNFHQTGHRSASNRAPREYYLPLKACYIGDRLINGSSTDPIYLVWNPGTNNFHISCRAIDEKHALVFLDRERHLHLVEFTHPSQASETYDGMPIVTLSIRPGLPVSFRTEPTVLLKTSDVHSITLKLNAHDVDWSPVKYDQFMSWIKHKVKANLSRNAKEIWEMAERTSASDDVEVVLPAHETPTTRSSAGFKTPDTRSQRGTPPDVHDVQESDVVNHQPFGPRRSARIRTVCTVKKPIIPVDPDEVILVYPQGVPGAINITNADVGRLQPGEFLNDTIIEFGLKLWHRKLEDSNPELAKQVHVFSSFFYKKLNKKNFEEGYDSIRKWTNKINLFEKKYIIIPINEHLHWYLAIIYMPEYILQPPTSPPLKQGAASRTRSRTSQAAERADDSDILTESGTSAAPTPVMEEESELGQHLDEFSCTVTVTEDNSPDGMDISPDSPTHQENHLVSTAPEQMDDFAMDVDKSEEDAVQEQLRLSSSPTVSELGASHRTNDHLDVERGLLYDQNNVVLSRFFAKEPEMSVLELDSQGQEITNTSSNDFKLDDLNQQQLDEEKEDGSDTSQRTFIFTLDSLGTRHPQATKQLSKYLKMEALDKLKNTNTRDPISKMVPVPTQPNFCDCGVYLLHFAKTFMTNPAFYFKTIVTDNKKSLPVNQRQVIWEDYKVGTMRQELVDRIRDLSKRWKEERAAKGEEKKDQTVTIKESDSSDIEYVDTAPAPAQGKAKAGRGGTTKKPKSAQMRG